MSASDSPPPVSSLLAQLHEERLRRQAAADSPNRDSVPAVPAAQGEQPAPRLSSPVGAIAGVHSNEAAPAPRSPQILPPPRDDGDGSHDQQQIPVAAVVPTPAHQDHESKAAAAAEADWDDFSCVVCLKLLLEPVALRCGHTFCRRCLQRALAVKRLCPVCRAPAESGAAGQAANVLISNLISKQFPRQLECRKAEEEEELEDLLNVRRPVFLLDLMVFPGQPIVLNVFEPRYTLMVNRIMEGNRQFAIQPTADSPLGTIVEITHVQALRGDAYLVQAIGRSRYHPVGAPTVEPETRGLHYGQLRIFKDEDVPPTLAPMARRLCDGLSGVAQRCLDRLQGFQRRAVMSRHGALPAHHLYNFSMWLASVVPAPPDTKVLMLQTTGTYDRLRLALGALQQVARIADGPGDGTTGVGGGNVQGGGAAAGAGGDAGAGARGGGDAGDSDSGNPPAGGEEDSVGTPATTARAGEVVRNEGAEDVGAGEMASMAAGLPPIVGEINDELFLELSRNLRPPAMFACLGGAPPHEASIWSQFLIFAAVMVLLYLFYAS